MFRSDFERELFLETLGEAVTKTKVLVHAWCLMPTRVHLVIETPAGNLSSAMKWLLGTFTMRISRRREKFGPLFAGRFKAVVVDGKSPGFFRNACESVHMNPARGRLVSPTDALRSYPWSSWAGYMDAGRCASWMTTERLKADLGLKSRDSRGLRAWEAAIESRRKTEDQIGPKLKWGWRYGSTEFRKRLRAMAQRRRSVGFGEETGRKPTEANAERLVREEMRNRGWRAADLKRLRKGDSGKVEVARRLKKETTATREWIVARLKMGTTGNLNRCLHAARNSTV